MMNGRSPYNANVRASESRAEFTPVMPSAAELGRSQRSHRGTTAYKRKQASDPQGGAEACV